ncbi:major facilitator superfamily domain-containing protein [Phascolomyces articulosus]|uniref:Major facilitator superfamily domain-containing protein n=1 Tax=Phascolomyces articulosus TaxID=60185 RepID=A0AAD5K5Z8_9FUNG|nr:major facilitator superfamily domain-containing protein [Phascolomyces articulosus]
MDNNTSSHSFVGIQPSSTSEMAEFTVKAYPIKSTGKSVENIATYIDPVIEKSLVRKLDLRIVTWSTIALFVDNLNRYNLQNAFIMGMDKDLDLNSNLYNWAVTIFFIAGTVLQIPGTVLIGRFSPRLILPSLFVLFGAMVCVTATVHNYQGLWAIRLVAGSVEAAAYPGLLFFMGCWYTTPELGKRITIFSAIGQALSGAFGGLISGAISDTLDGAHGLAAWKWLFIIEGLLCVGVGLIGYPILGDFPHNTKWLTEEERGVAMLRVKYQGLGTVFSASFNWKKVTKNVMLNPYTWLLTINCGCIFFGLNLVFNFSIILRDMGYTTSFSNYMLTPVNIFMAVVSIAFSWTSDRTGDRAFHLAALQFFTGIWFLIPALVGHGNNPAALIFVATYGTTVNTTSATLCPTWINEIYKADHDARAIAVAFTNAVGYIITNFINVKTWDVSDSPTFWLGKITAMAFSFGSVVLTMTVWFLLRINAMVPKATGGEEQQENHSKVIITANPTEGYKEPIE